MKRMIVLMLILILLGGISQAFGEGNAKVLMMPREGYSADLDLMIKMEIGVMKILLKNAGLDVDIATSSGLPIVGPTEKITDVKWLRNIKIDDYAGVIIPCMAVEEQCNHIRLYHLKP